MHVKVVNTQCNQTYSEALADFLTPSDFFSGEIIGRLAASLVEKEVFTLDEITAIVHPDLSVEHITIEKTTDT